MYNFPYIIIHSILEISPFSHLFTRFLQPKAPPRDSFRRCSRLPTAGWAAPRMSTCDPRYTWGMENDWIL